MLCSMCATLTITVADYRDFLSGISDADLVLTDPPYAISKPSNFANGGIDKYDLYKTDFGDWDQAEIDLGALAEGCYSALRPGGTAIIFYDMWKLTDLRDAMESAGFKMLRLVEWVKTNPVPVNSKRFYLNNSRELAVAAVKDGKPTFNAAQHTGRYEYPIPQHSNRIHPTQKNDDLVRDLIEMHTNRGDMVIDPFAGGGTTLIAAAMTGRSAAGCDINEEYVDKIVTRAHNERGLLWW